MALSITVLVFTSHLPLMNAEAIELGTYQAHPMEVLHVEQVELRQAFGQVGMFTLPEGVGVVTGRHCWKRYTPTVGSPAPTHLQSVLPKQAPQSV